VDHTKNFVIGHKLETQMQQRKRVNGSTSCTQTTGMKPHAHRPLYCKVPKKLLQT